MKTIYALLCAVTCYSISLPAQVEQPSWEISCDDAVSIINTHGNSICIALNNTVDSLATQPTVIGVFDSAKSTFSEAWFIVEIGSFLTLRGISPIACQQFINNNKQLIGKMLPMLCSVSYRIINELLSTSQAPEDLKQTLEKLASYGNSYNLVIKTAQQVTDSTETTLKKNNLINKILDKLGYNFAQSLLLEILSTNPYVQKFLPSGINAQTLTSLLDRHIRNILLEFCTEAELFAFVSFIETNTGKKLMKPSTLEGLKDIVVKRYLDGDFQQKVQATAEQIAAPVITVLQASSTK